MRDLGDLRGRTFRYTERHHDSVLCGRLRTFDADGFCPHVARHPKIARRCVQHNVDSGLMEEVTLGFPCAEGRKDICVCPLHYSENMAAFSYAGAQQLQARAALEASPPLPLPTIAVERKPAPPCACGHPAGPGRHFESHCREIKVVLAPPPEKTPKAFRCACGGALPEVGDFVHGDADCREISPPTPDGTQAEIFIRRCACLKPTCASCNGRPNIDAERGHAMRCLDACAEKERRAAHPGSTHFSPDHLMGGLLTFRR